MGLKVLIAAGSNKAVDNLAAAVYARLKNPEIRQWWPIRTLPIAHAADGCPPQG